MSFTVREGTGADYEQARDLFNGLIEMHAQALPHIFHRPDDSFYPESKHADYIAADDKAVFVAERDGRVVGAVCIRIEHMPRSAALQAREYAYLERVAVADESRRQGVGQALIERAHQWARDRGVDMVELHVKGFNEKAIGLYRKLGYEPKRLEMWRPLNNLSVD